MLNECPSIGTALYSYKETLHTGNASNLTIIPLLVIPSDIELRSNENLTWLFNYLYVLNGLNLWSTTMNF